MSINSNAAFGITAAAAVIAMFGFAGRIDYEAERALECASMRKPHGYDSKADACVPITITVNQDLYYASPEKSRPVRDEGTLPASGHRGPR